MTSSHIIQYINLEQFPDILDIIEKCYVRLNVLHIEIKKPIADKVHVTIQPNYTRFRYQVERLLKEKGLSNEERIHVLRMVDNSHDLIFPESTSQTNQDNNNNHEASDQLQSDRSDTSDDQKLDVTVSECIKLNSGKVKVEGNIISLSQPFKMVSSIINTCECGKSRDKTALYHPPLYGLGDKFDQKCKDCGAEKIVNYRNVITVELQDSEKFNDIDRITCILLDADTSSIRLGERVSVVGEVYVQNNGGKGLLIPKVFATKLEYPEKYTLAINPLDIKAISKFATLKGPSIIDALVNMFDQSIIENNTPKEAIIYGLVSAGDDIKEINSYHRRSRMNVLLVGPPGHAKSSLLRKATKLIPNSTYESIQHSSAKSLTAIISKVDDHHSLMLGPIPMARESIACLNEIATMLIEDQNYLLDIMEEGGFTINKYGFKCKISSPTVIIASANAQKSSWLMPSENYKISLDEIPLIRPLLDRFDLLVISNEVGGPEAAEKYAEGKLEIISKKVPNYDPFLTKYLEYARKVKPVLGEEAKEMIRKYYVDLYTQNRNLKSKRVLETLFRLCSAVAKLMLSNTVEPEHVTRATKFYNILINNYLDSIVSVPQNPVTEIVQKCKDILKDNNGKPFTISEIIKQVCVENKHHRYYLLNSKALPIDENILSMDKNKKIRKVSDTLRVDSEVKVVNKNPIKFVFDDNSLEVDGQRSQMSQMECHIQTVEPK